jgi:hypothetical protein
MSLLDRLKPEFIVKLGSIEQQYPATFECITTSVRNNEFYTELKICDVISLFSHLNLDLNISNLNTLFIS